MTPDERFMLRVLGAAVVRLVLTVGVATAVLLGLLAVSHAQQCRDWGQIECFCEDGTRLPACADCGDPNSVSQACTEPCRDHGGYDPGVPDFCDARPQEPHAESECWDGDANNSLVQVVCAGGLHSVCDNVNALGFVIDSIPGCQGSVERFEVFVNRCAVDDGAFERNRWCNDASDCSGSELCVPTPGEPVNTCQPPEEAAKCQPTVEEASAGDFTCLELLSMALERCGN